MNLPNRPGEGNRPLAGGEAGPGRREGSAWMSALHDEPGTILEWTTSAGQGNETGASPHSK